MSEKEQDENQDNEVKAESDENSEVEESYDKPVDRGDVVELEIEDIGSKGDGIARIEGFVVFVPEGEVGRTYKVEITQVGKKFGFSEILEEIEDLN